MDSLATRSVALHRVGMWRLALILTLLVPANAFGWRQTKTCIFDIPPAPTTTPFCEEGDVPYGFRWEQPPVHFSINRGGSDDFPTGDGTIAPELEDALIASFETWNGPECSEFEFVYDGLTDVDGFDRADGLNVVVFQDDEWPYSGMALAVTTVTADPRGKILNADMELNGVDHEFGIVTDGENVWDVQNTVTHEAGHILGLDHDAVEESTMEFEAARGETIKRTLLTDDSEGLCEIYPILPATQAEPDDGCCATTNPGRPPVELLLVGLGLLGWRRRR